MFDAEWLVEQYEEAIELVISKIRDSKTSNPQMWYLLQAQNTLLRDYWDMLKLPSHKVLDEIQAKLITIDNELKLLKAKGQIETVSFGKKGLGGAQ